MIVADLKTVLCRDLGLTDGPDTTCSRRVDGPMVATEPGMYFVVVVCWGVLSDP